MKQEYWRYARCKYTKMELKYYILWGKYDLGRNTIFKHFFRTLKSKKSFLEVFSENHDFSLKTMLLSSNRGCKINFLVKLFFKLFLFLENLQNGFFTFLISAFNQKLHRETYTQFSDFHDFRRWSEMVFGEKSRFS